MHKAKNPPFAEKGRAFFEGTIVSMSSLFYETVKKILFILRNYCSYEQNMLRIMNKKWAEPFIKILDASWNYKIYYFISVWLICYAQKRNRVTNRSQSGIFLWEGGRKCRKNATILYMIILCYLNVLPALRTVYEQHYAH